MFVSYRWTSRVSAAQLRPKIFTNCGELPGEGRFTNSAEVKLNRSLLDFTSYAAPCRAATPISSSLLVTLRAFHDFLWVNGNEPVSLQRWEYSGLRYEIESVDAMPGK